MDRFFQACGRCFFLAYSHHRRDYSVQKPYFQNARFLVGPSHLHFVVGKAFISLPGSHLHNQLFGPVLPVAPCLTYFEPSISRRAYDFTSDYGSCGRLSAYRNDMVRGLLSGRTLDTRGLQYSGSFRFRQQRVSPIAALLFQFRHPDVDRLRRYCGGSSNRADVSDPGGSGRPTLPCNPHRTARFSSNTVEAENLKP